MQIISTSSYKDINICNPINGTNCFTNSIRIFQYSINKDVVRNGTLLTNIKLPLEYSIYIYSLNINIKKYFNDCVNKYEVNNNNFFVTCNEANQFSKFDNISVSWFQTNESSEYNKIHIDIVPYINDVNLYLNNPNYAYKCTGKLTVYAIY